MKKDEFDAWLQNSLQDHDSPIPMGGWQGLHLARKKKKRFGFFWLLSASVFVLFGALGAYLFINTQVDPSTETVSVTNETPTDNTPIESAPQELFQQEPTQIESIGSPVDKEIQQNKIGANKSSAPYLSSINKKTAAPSKVNAVVPIEKPQEEIDSESIPELPEAIENHTISFKKPGHDSTLIPLKAHVTLPRSSRFLGLYAELGAHLGEMHLKVNPAAEVEPNYSVLLNKSTLLASSWNFNLGAEFRLTPRWSLRSGIGYQQLAFKGTVDYAFYTYEPNSIGNTNQSWTQNPDLIANSFRYDVELNSQRLLVPAVLRYRLFYGNSPLFELGGTYMYSLKNTGKWIGPEDLQPITIDNSFSRRHHFQPQVALGYEWNLAAGRLAVRYQYSPWTASYTPPKGKMGSNQHGLTLQWQMPY